MRSSSSEIGRSFHTRTCPSRPHVATRWYERPHDGAHDMEVIAYGAVVFGHGSRLDRWRGIKQKSMIGRRKRDNCIIYDTPVSAFREMRNEWKSDLHNATHAAADREHLTPVSLLAPRERPPTVGLTASCASLDVRVVSRQGQSTRHGSIFVRYVHSALFLLGTVAGATRPQRVKRLRPRCRISVLGGCRIGMRTRRQHGKKRWNVRFFQHHPVCQSGRLEALIHAQVIVRGNCRLLKGQPSRFMTAERCEERTNFNPNWWGANSTPRTLPCASANTAWLTQRVPGPLAAADAHSFEAVRYCQQGSPPISSPSDQTRNPPEPNRTRDEPTKVSSHSPQQHRELSKFFSSIT